MIPAPASIRPNLNLPFWACAASLWPAHGPLTPSPDSGKRPATFGAGPSGLPSKFSLQEKDLVSLLAPGPAALCRIRLHRLAVAARRSHHLYDRLAAHHRAA